MPGKKGQRSRKVAVIDAKRSRVMRRGMDGRSRDVRYMRAVQTQLIEDLGGRDELSIQKLSLVEEAAYAMTRIRRLKLDRLVGTPVDDKSYAALLNSLLGIYGKLGLERKAKRIASVQELIAAESAKP